VDASLLSRGPFCIPRSAQKRFLARPSMADAAWWRFLLLALWPAAILACLVGSGGVKGALPLAWHRIAAAALVSPFGHGWTALAALAIMLPVLPLGVASGFLQVRGWDLSVSTASGADLPGPRKAVDMDTSGPRGTQEVATPTTLLESPKRWTMHEPRPRLQRPRWPGSVGKVLTVGAVSFFAPGMLEELLFRVIALPGKEEDFNWFVATCMIFVFSVVYHADAIHRPHEVFDDWRFLCASLAIGVACTVVYARTGSWCLAAVVHWLPVWLWLSFFGGKEKIDHCHGKVDQALVTDGPVLSP